MTSKVKNITILTIIVALLIVFKLSSTLYYEFYGKYKKIIVYDILNNYKNDNTTDIYTFSLKDCDSIYYFSHISDVLTLVETDKVLMNEYRKAYKFYYKIHETINFDDIYSLWIIYKEKKRTCIIFNRYSYIDRPEFQFIEFNNNSQVVIKNNDKFRIKDKIFSGQKYYTLTRI